MNETSEKVAILGTFEIGEGQRGALEAFVKKAVEIARGEPGCLVYRAWIADDGRSLHWFEQYRDSQAVLAHLGNMQALIPELMACVTPSGFTMYGPASEQLRAAVAAFGMRHMRSAGGFER